MEKKNTLGVILSFTGIVNGLLLLFWIAAIYSPVVSTKIAQGHGYEAITVRIVFAVLGWMALSAGALWAAVLYGFVKGKDWAWFWGIVAATFQILPGFFPFIPAASVHIFSKTLFSFAIALILWFAMLWMGKIKGKIIWISFLAGLAYIFSFIDGVGSIARYQMVNKGIALGIYGLSQMVNWWAAIGIAIFIFGLVKKKFWAISEGVFATTLSMLGGFPMGIMDALRIGRFSLFLVAPITSTILLIVILLNAKEVE